MVSVSSMPATRSQVLPNQQVIKLEGDEEALLQVVCKPPGRITEYVRAYEFTQRRKVQFINRLDQESLQKMASQLSQVFTQAEKLAIIYQKYKRYCDHTKIFLPEQLVVDRHIADLSKGIAVAESYNGLRLLQNRILSIIYEESLDPRHDERVKKSLFTSANSLFLIFYKLEDSMNYGQNVKKEVSAFNEALKELSLLVPAFIKELTALKNEQNSSRICELQQELNFLFNCVKESTKLYPFLLTPFRYGGGKPILPSTRGSLDESLRIARVYTLAIQCLHQELKERFDETQGKVKQYAFSEEVGFIKMSLLDILHNLASRVSLVRENLIPLLNVMMVRSSSAELDSVLKAFDSQEGNKKEQIQAIMLYLDSLNVIRTQIHKKYEEIVKAMQVPFTEAQTFGVIFNQMLAETKKKQQPGLLAVVSKFNSVVDRTRMLMTSHLLHTNHLMNVSSGALVNAAKDLWNKVQKELEAAEKGSSTAASASPAAAAAAAAGEAAVVAEKTAAAAKPVIAVAASAAVSEALPAMAVAAPAAPAASPSPEERPVMAVAVAAAAAPAPAVQVQRAAEGHVDLVKWFEKHRGDRKMSYTLRSSELRALQVPSGKELEEIRRKAAEARKAREKSSS